MTLRTSATEPSIRLPATFAIGFTGHRALRDEAKCRKSIFDILQQRKTPTSELLYGIASVAVGGDLLFAETCVQLGLPLCVLLPMPKEEFRKDFDEVGWSRVEKVLRHAASVEVIGGNRSREECYYECGIETVQRSQVVLALWDGESSRGPGGTEDIVSFARGLGTPVIWLHSISGDVHIFNAKTEKELRDDPELDFLNNLQDPAAHGNTNRPEDLARGWFRKVDEGAARFAPQVRRLAAIPIVFTAAAALFSGAGSWAHRIGTWLTIGTVLGIMAAVLPVALQLKKRQILWLRTRTAAEVCRSVLAFWGTPTPYEAIEPEVVPELSGVLRSLNFLKILDCGRNNASLEEFKRRYRQDRVVSQTAYFSDHSAKSAKEGRRYRITTWACTGLAAVVNVCLFLAKHANGRLGEGMWEQWLAFGSSVAFQIATVAGALIAVNDCERRAQHYRELSQQVMKWDAQLEALRTWASVLRVAGQIERALLAELIEWRSLIRNQRLGKK